jgi:hypothetical protein
MDSRMPALMKLRRLYDEMSRGEDGGDPVDLT